MNLFRTSFLEIILNGLFLGLSLSFADDDAGAGGGREGEGEGEGEGTGGKGEGDENWRNSLPEEIRENPAFDNFNSLKDVAKSYLGTQKLVGKDKIPLPSDEDDKETWDVVFNRLGRPESPDEYKLPEDIEGKEQVPLTEELVENFKKSAHSLGLNKKQVEGLYKEHIGAMANVKQQLDQKRDENAQKAEAGLRKEWGKAYGEKVKLAQKTFEKFADEDTVAKFSDGLGNDPQIIKLFAKVGSVLSEDQLEGKPTTGLSYSPEEAQAEINKIMGNKEHPYFDADHPEHEAAVNKMQSLYKMVHPAEKKAA